jgi:hypothetical protein
MSGGIGTFYPLGVKPPEARQPLLWTDRLLADELKYSRDRARRRRRPTNNLSEV